MAANIRSEFSDCQWYQWQPMVAKDTNSQITMGTKGKPQTEPYIYCMHVPNYSNPDEATTGYDGEVLVQQNTRVLH